MSLYPTLVSSGCYIQLGQSGTFPQVNLNCTHYLFSSSSMKNISLKNDIGLDDLKQIRQVSSLVLPSDERTISCPSGNCTEKGQVLVPSGCSSSGSLTPIRDGLC